LREEAALATPAKRLTNKTMKALIPKLSSLPSQSTYTCACKSLMLIIGNILVENWLNLPEIAMFLLNFGDRVLKNSRWQPSGIRAPELSHLSGFLGFHL